MGFFYYSTLMTLIEQIFTDKSKTFYQFSIEINLHISIKIRAISVLYPERLLLIQRS